MKLLLNVALFLLVSLSGVSAYSDQVPPANIVTLVNDNYIVSSVFGSPPLIQGTTIYTVPAGETFVLTDFDIKFTTNPTTGICWILEGDTNGATPEMLSFENTTPTSDGPGPGWHYHSDVGIPFKAESMVYMRCNDPQNNGPESFAYQGTGYLTP